MVGRGGVEPPTSRLSGVRSNHLSYRPGALQAAFYSSARRSKACQADTLCCQSVFSSDEGT